MSTVDQGEWRCVGCGRSYTDRAPGDLCPHDDRVLVPAPTAERFGGDALLGRRLADNYLIFDILGLGGFGAVYRAIDIESDRRQVAIKTIRPGAERHNADARARFTQEARLLERLRDPHIVEVYHYGEADDALFMALELVPGRSLKRILRSRKRLPPRRAVHITAQILSALEHAHALGLVHRDLKPANILVVERRDDTVKVIDFGIAKVLEAEDEDEGPKTGTGLVLGTVRYMAPEQLRQGGEIGAATDCYAVGIMFYEMLAGRAPFDGSQAEIAAAHLYQPAPALDPALAPPTLRAWLERVLLKDPEARFLDAADMRRALLEALPDAADAESRDDTGGLPPISDDRPSGSMDGISGPSEGAVRVLAEAVKSASTAGPERPVPDAVPATSTMDAPDGDPTTASAEHPAADGAEDGGSTGHSPADMDPADHPGSTLPDGALAADGPPVESPALPDAPHDEDETFLEPPTVESPLVVAEPAAPPTVESPQVFDPELAALPNLAPEGDSGWGDIDQGPALRETSGTIQAARGELGLVEEPADDNRRMLWLAGAALAIAAAALLALAPWSDDGAGENEPVETIRLSVGSQPPPPQPVEPPVEVPVEPPVMAVADAALPVDAAPVDAAPKRKPRKRSMPWRQVQKLEAPIGEALSVCRCSQAHGLLGKLPRDFPRDRRRRLQRRIDKCKVPLVDQQCVDGEVR